MVKSLKWIWNFSLFKLLINKQIRPISVFETTKFWVQISPTLKAKLFFAVNKPRQRTAASFQFKSNQNQVREELFRAYVSNLIPLFHALVIMEPTVNEYSCSTYVNRKKKRLGWQPMISDQSRKFKRWFLFLKYKNSTFSEVLENMRKMTFLKLSCYFRKNYFLPIFDSTLASLELGVSLLLSCSLGSKDPSWIHRHISS